MAERRMFAKSIVTSDAFLDMPMSARLLYFTLGMFADDDGFVNSPKSIIRQIGSSQDDLSVLIAKRYVLCFPSGVIVIKHWRINNYLQNDRHKPTTYIEELNTLTLDEKGSYTEKKQCIQNVYKMYTQDSIGKDSVEVSKQVSKEKNNYLLNQSAGASAREGEENFKTKSYDEVLDDFAVEGRYREAVFRFIAHLNANGKNMINDRLEKMIIALDMKYRTDDNKKIAEIDEAIRKSYWYLPAEEGN